MKPRIPWNDPSGDRLRTWLGLTTGQFYDLRKVTIIPMGFCYPGKAASGDSRPRPEMRATLARIAQCPFA